MGSKMRRFAQRDSDAPGGAQSATTAQDHFEHQRKNGLVRHNRPGTAQKIYGNTNQPEGNHAYDTDAESFDESHPTLNHGHEMVANDHGVQSEYGDEDDPDENDENDGEDRHATPFGRFNNGGYETLGVLQNQTHQQRDQRARLEEVPDSYPPTTSGEPDIEYEPETHQNQPNAQWNTQAAIYPQQNGIQAATVPLKMASIANPVAVRQRPDAHLQPQNILAVAQIPKPPPAHTPNLRQPLVNQTSSGRKQIDPREFHVDQEAVSGLIGHDQNHMNTEEMHDAHQDELDYDLEELYKKDFASLQNDPFDGPPPEKSEVNPPKSGPQSLEEKLAAAAKQDRNGQRNFFTTLSIDEWDEAGDWFQERFSEILNKLRAARKQKRRLAEEFEKEVSQRQQMLVKKRKDTDDAMDMMKSSGAEVLKNTPRKKQKHSM